MPQFWDPEMTSLTPAGWQYRSYTEKVSLTSATCTAAAVTLVSKTAVVLFATMVVAEAPDAAIGTVSEKELPWLSETVKVPLLERPKF